VSKPTPKQFAEFYEAVNGFEPFPWHVRLAERVCNGDWPRAIALPTAAGKTSCIDIAVFALACGAKNAARRIFFVVDRRIVVDQAFEHAKKLAERLRTPETKVERLVGEVLRDIAFPDWRDLPDEAQKDVRPLDVYALRGGMYRESAWTRSPLQPTVITSTVDQVGSRLLFRGYGVSDSMRPIHAGLVGNDALILLDEAHCAKPFDETMQAVKTFRHWHDSHTPFAFVSLTATPTTDENVMHADKADEKHSVLGKRIKASKPATLVAGKATAAKKAQEELLILLEKHARELAKEYACVGIIVNRVKTARQLRDSLKQEFDGEVVLLTGRMRPLDRDHIYNARLKSLVSKPEDDKPPPKFVIGTQCLECGADFDFHALVTECASLDAMRQRFGRLNRVANRPSANAVVVIRGDQIEPKEVDPIYGNSLSQTWNWLNIVAPDGVFDFGVSNVREALLDVSREELEQLNAPAESAPVLFPAHLDCWVQTHPTPTPDPDPALFLHGPERPGQPDVQVVFRADLGADSESWVDIVTLCPPSSSEAVAVPISVFKNWLAGERIDDQSSDVEGEKIEGEKIEADEEPEGNSPDRRAVCWRGPEESRLVSRRDEVQPNQVFVIPCSAPDVRSLADFISDVPTDYAEEAFQKSRDKALLRLPGLELDEDDEFDSKLSDAIEQQIAAQFPNWTDRATASLLERRRMIERYPEPLKGFVVSGRKRLGQFDPTYLDDTEPADSYLGQVITLDTHSRGVAEFAKHFAESCGLDTELYYTAGLCHDLGKLDPRFQAMLKQCSPRTAVGTPWAKSAKAPRTPRERKLARLVHHYPKSARHELLSAAMLASVTSDDLLLHLVATHHGSGRPFAGAVEENDLRKPFERDHFGQGFKIDSSRQDIAAWNATLPERFWRIVRKLGWWGSAYHETVFRLADHAQSRREQETPPPRDRNGYGVNLPPRVALRDNQLPLTGLDGSNPLAFLAALGTLRLTDRAYPGTRLSWQALGWWSPVLHLPVAVSQDDLIAALLSQMDTRRRCMSFAPDLKIMADEFRRFEAEAVANARDDREYADFIRAFADPLITIQGGPNAGKTKPTEFYFIAGQQKLIRQAIEIAMAAKSEHVRKCLFADWMYDDPLKGLSLRWDPQDDFRYATRFFNPSDDKSKAKRGSVLGANRLAFEALPLFPCFARGNRLATTGFTVVQKRPFFTWPIWSAACGVDAVRSLLAIAPSPGLGSAIRPPTHIGAAAWYQCEKVANSDYFNFTPSIAI
jgi:CRISPR-associated endonuclease/helicase Cas3